MELARLEYLCGDGAADVLDEYDLADESGRMQFVEDFLALPNDARELGGRMALRTIAVNQILDDDPPETWQTVERLRDLGLDREQVLSQLSMVIAEQVKRSLDEAAAFDRDEYVSQLYDLPLPTSADIAQRLIDVARSTPGIAAGDHVDEVVAAIAPANEDVVSSLVDKVLETMIDGPLHWLPDDLTMVVPDLVDGRVFTHRFNEVEAELQVLSAGFDLGAFSRFDTIRLPDGTVVEQFSVEHGHLGWRGDDGWLAAFEPGDLLAISAAIDTFDVAAPGTIEATLTIEVLDAEPVADDGTLAAVRAAYDAEVAEPGLPVTGDHLAFWLLFHHPELVGGAPLPTLSDLCAGAGLEQQGGFVAHDAATWRRALSHRRFHRVMDMVPEREWRLTLGRAVETLDDPDAAVDDVRAVLADCAAPEALDVLADVLIPHGLELADEFNRDVAESPGRLFDLVNRAVAVARRPRETATAEYLACVLYERCGAAEIAEQHLKRAVDAQPRLGTVVERMGWYRFDRGDARGAMRWWRELSEVPDAASTILQVAAPKSDGRKLGRNDPCWCGSGRKFKQCHQNASDLPALPDRVAWLCRKASVWLEHSAGDVRDIVTQMSMARATGDPDGELGDLDHLGEFELGELFREVFDDPIVFDTALHEGHLFSSFLHERGSLLPDDEQLLAASWLTVERSVHEVVAVDVGVGLTMRDLASGEVAEVRERTLSRDASVGERYCARVVPDGQSNQMIGSVFPVRTGHERAVLDLCAERDGAELCAWVAVLHRPAHITHTPGLIDELFDRDAIEAVARRSRP